MPNLSQRLQDGLIGDCETTGTVGGIERNSVRLEQSKRVKPTIATIEADLKGLILETIGHAESCPLYRHPDEDDGCECACHIADIDAAIERYTRGE